MRSGQGKPGVPSKPPRKARGRPPRSGAKRMGVSGMSSRDDPSRNVDTSAAAAPPLSFWLRSAARSYPMSPALEYKGAVLDYQELWRRTDQLAARLRAARLTGGDRVAIAATRSPYTMVAILAAVEAGVAYVPLDLAYPADRLQIMLRDARPRAVLGEPEALAALRSAVGDFPTLDRPAPQQDRPHAAATDLTYVLFTSGSTGRPKGVAMGATPLRYLIAWHAQHPRLGQMARTLQFAPLSFDVHFQEIFSTLACAGTLVLLPEEQRRDPSLLHAALIERRIERIFVPYVALQMLADAARDVAPGYLRDVISAGEQLQITPAIRSLFTRLPEAQLHNHYGPTESHVVTAHELRGDASSWPEIPPIGAPLPHVRLAQRDVESGRIEGDTGELLLGGDTLAHGYLGSAELSAERFREDIDGLAGRWYVTGDLVRRGAAGLYTYLGRVDQQLKVDGFRIEPGEIELALMTHDMVKDAVVTAPELPRTGRQLVAHVVLRDPQANASAAAMQLRSHLRARLPEYMVPVRYVALDRLPLTPSGKIDRRGLPPLEIDASETGGDPIEVVRTLWQELLGLPQIGDDQNVFDLGARSLLVLRFVARLKELGVSGLSVADIYDRPTVAGIGAALAPLPRRPPTPMASRLSAWRRACLARAMSKLSGRICSPGAKVSVTSRMRNSIRRSRNPCVGLRISWPRAACWSAPTVSMLRSSEFPLGKRPCWIPSNAFFWSPAGRPWNTRLSIRLARMRASASMPVPATTATRARCEASSRSWCSNTASSRPCWRARRTMSPPA